MPADGWLQWALAVGMAAVAVYHLWRLSSSRGGPARVRIDVEFTHVAMAAAMAAMVLGELATPHTPLFAVIFVVPMMWFGCCGVHTYVMDGPTYRARALAGPAAGCAAMVYMLAMPVPASASSMSAMHTPNASSATAGPGGLLVAFAAVLVVWAVGRTAFRRSALLGSPVGSAVGTGCRLAVATTTLYMLAM